MHASIRRLGLLLGLVMASVGCVTITIHPTSDPTVTAAPSAPPTEPPTPTPGITAAPSDAPTPAPTFVRVTFDELNANAEIATFDELRTQSIDWIARTIYLKGIVDWTVPQEPQGALMGIEVDADHDLIYMRYTGTDTFTIGAWVEFVAQYSGLFDYDTAGGDHVTLPAFQTVGQANIRLAAVQGFGDELTACTDRAHQTFSYHWTEPYRWSFNAASVPDYLDRDEVLNVLKRSMDNITDARNDCGLPDHVSATAEYMGLTDDKTGIKAPAICPPADGVSVIGFGRLAPDLLGLTCPIWHDTVATEVDIAFNSRAGWALSSDDCIFAELLEATATHEIGHAFGLAHVSEGKHGDLTMSTTSNGPCDAEEITLGLGDVLGLEQLYPQ